MKFCKAGPGPQNDREDRVNKIVDCKFVGSFFDLKQIPDKGRVQVALAGRSNVGKSSLLNRLVGRKNMAKASNTPGKTRSLNFFLINDRFFLVDLPGYGYAKVSKTMQRDWGKLTEDYLTQSGSLAGLVLLLDCRREPNEQDLQLIDWLGANGLPVMIVVTKTDKINRDQVNRKIKQMESQLNLQAIPFSTVTGIGKNQLLQAVFKLVNEQGKSMRV